MIHMDNASFIMRVLQRVGSAEWGTAVRSAFESFVTIRCEFKTLPLIKTILHILRVQMLLLFHMIPRV